MEARKYAVIMEITNSFIRDGIVMNLMESVVKGINELLNSSLRPIYKEFVVECMTMISECLFFICYQTQITSAESAALTELISKLSSTVISQTDDSALMWLSGSQRVLAILHLTQFRALNQVDNLYSRDIDSWPYFSGEVGNNLPTPAGSRDGMEHEWVCGMAKGVSCLAHAILRQPAVEASILRSSEVLWFLRQSSIHRAFTYIRCCMLPVLHTMHANPNQQLYLSVLCDLVFNSLTLFCQSNYHATGFPYPVTQVRHAFDNSNYFQFALVNTAVCFFLCAHHQESYREDKQWRRAYSDTPAADGRATAAAAGAGAGGDLIALPPRDTQEDVSACVAVLSAAYPPFAKRFWKPIPAAPSALAATMSSTLRDRGDMSHHPFLERAFDGLLHDRSLLIPVLCMLGSISRGAGAEVPSLSAKFNVGNIDGFSLGSTSCALATYRFVLRRHAGNFDWKFLFDTVESYINYMQPRSAATAGSTGGKPDAARAAPAAPKPLQPQDVNALCAVVALVGSVCQEAAVLNSFRAQNYQPVQRLFGLLSCPVPCRLKGRIYAALSAMARSSAEAARDIWDALEAYQVLSMSPGAAGDAGVGQCGLRYELEHIESPEGYYPATEGFLGLLGELLTHHRIPESLGLGYRLPGVSGYIDFVIDEVLLKAADRNYIGVQPGTRLFDSVSSTAQRWSIMTRCFKILSAVLHQYPIHELAPVASARSQTPKPEGDAAEFYLDFSEETNEYIIDGCGPTGAALADSAVATRQLKQVLPRPKSSGFSVMIRLLDSYGALLSCLMSVLRENSRQMLDEVSRRQLDSRSLDALRFLSVCCNSAAQAPEFQSTFASSMLIGDYGLLTMSQTLTDTLFWREKCVSAAVGLLYECSIREDRFLANLRASPPLTVLRSVRGRLTVQDVHACETFLSMAAFQAQSPQAIVAHYIRYAPVASRQSLCVPSVPVMAVRILETAVPSDPSEQQALLRSVDIFNAPPAFSSAGGRADTSKFATGLTATCAGALRESPDELNLSLGISAVAASSVRHGAAPPSDVIPLGAANLISLYDRYSQTLSDDFSYSTSINVAARALVPPTADEIVTLLQASAPAAGRFSGEHRGALTAVEPLNWSSYGITSASPQCAVLDLLLRGLALKKYYLVHRLLGFSEVEVSPADVGGRRAISGISGKIVNTSRKIVLSDPSGKSDNCFTAALDVLDAIHGRLLSDGLVDPGAADAAEMDVDAAFQLDSRAKLSIHTYDIANKCMELLYHLCVNPATSEISLDLIRKHHSRVSGGLSGPGAEFPGCLYSFYTNQLHLCLQWATLPPSQDGEPSRPMLQACKLNYVSWFLKILALELHTADFQTDSNASSRHVTRLLSQLLGGDSRAGDTDPVRFASGNAIPLMTLWHIVPPPERYLNFSMESATAQKCFQSCLKPLHLGVVSSYSRSAGSAEQVTYELCPIVDMKELARALGRTKGADMISVADGGEVSVSEALERCLAVAAKYNAYAVRMASSSLTSQAWRQVLDISLLMDGNLRSKFQSFVEGLVIPLITHLATQPDTEMVIGEPLARAILTASAVMREVCAQKLLEISGLQPNGDADGAIGALLSDSQHETIFVGIIDAILRRGTPGVPRINGSVLYRCFLYAALTHVIRLMNVASAAAESDPSAPRGAALKACEEAAYEYRVRTMVSIVY